MCVYKVVVVVDVVKGVAAFAGGWIGVDLVWQWLGNRKEWGDVKHGKCGMRCCWDDHGDCCKGFRADWCSEWCSLWGTTFASPASTLLSLFTSMPLSTKKRDRTRLFFLSTSVTLVMALCAIFLGYQALLEQRSAAVTPFSLSNASAINGSGEAGGAVGSGEAAASGEAADETIQTAESASPATLAVVFATLVVKALAYLFGLRGGVLEKGQGAVEAAGFSALFALSDVAGDQMESWTGNEWATFFKDPANTEVELYDKGFTDGVGKNIGVGLQLAGADCKVVTLK